MFTEVHCKTCIYSYKLIWATGSLLEFELHTLKLLTHLTFYLCVLRIPVRIVNIYIAYI